MHNAQFWVNMMSSKSVDATEYRQQHEYIRAADSSTVNSALYYYPVALGQYIFIMSLHTKCIYEVST